MCTVPSTQIEHRIYPIDHGKTAHTCGATGVIARDQRRRFAVAANLNLLQINGDALCEIVGDRAGMEMHRDGANKRLVAAQNADHRRRKAAFATIRGMARKLLHRIV